MHGAYNSDWPLRVSFISLALKQFKFKKISLALIELLPLKLVLNVIFFYLHLYLSISYLCLPPSSFYFDLCLLNSRQFTALQF